MFNLHIHNFRSFQHQNFEFSKVNLLIGTNSSGKSSLLKFLRMLKQSFNNRNANLVIKGDELDLSNYERIIYNNKNENNLEYSFSFGKEYFDYFISQYDKKNDHLRK